MDIPNVRTCHFEASEDIMTKFKSQGLHIIRINMRLEQGTADDALTIRSDVVSIVDSKLVKEKNKHLR